MPLILPRAAADYQLAWLLSAVTCIDLTTLAGDDTPDSVKRLCAKAKQPVSAEVLDKLGCAGKEFKCGAVCVYPARVADAVACLKGSCIPVASVATGFPSGQITHEHKLAEIRQCVADGAMEIDIVIPRTHALRGDWEALYKEVKAELVGKGIVKRGMGRSDSVFLADA